MATEAEVESLFVRFTGDMSAYAATLAASIQATEAAVKIIEAATAKLVKSGADGSAEGAKRASDLAKAEAEKAKLMAEGARVTRSVETASERYSRTLSELNNLLGAGAISTDTYSRAALAASRAYKDASSSMSGLTDSVRAYATAVVTATTVTLAFGGARRAISLASEAESAEVAFGTMLKSMERGKQMVADIQKLAADTPLTQNDLMPASRTLLQFGVSGSKVIPTLKLLGDVTGADAQRLQSMSLAFGQMSAAGRLMGQDLLQMVNAGFNPLNEISRTTGKSMAVLKDEMEKGQITVKMVEDALISATSAGGQFEGFMEKQSKTLKGVWSTAKDDVDASLRTIGKELVDNLYIKDIVKGISEAAKALTDWVKNLSGTSKTLLAIVVGVTAAIAALTLTVVAASLAVRGAVLVWTLATEVLTLVATKFSMASLAAGGFKLALIGLGIYAVKALYDIVTGADEARRRLEEMKKTSEEIKNNMDKSTDKFIKDVMGLTDVEDKLKKVNAELEQINGKSIDPKLLKGLEPPDPSKYKNFIDLVEALQQFNSKLPASNPGQMAEALESQRKVIERLNYLRQHGIEGIKEKYTPGMDTKGAIDIEEKYKNRIDATVEALKARKDKLTELQEELKKASMDSGQLSVTFKKVKDELKEINDFAGLDKYNKQLVELDIIMTKLNTDPSIRKRIMDEVMLAQAAAKQKELTVAVRDYTMALMEEQRTMGQTTEQQKYMELVRKGAKGAQMDTLAATISTTLAMKDQVRLMEEGKKLMEEYKDPVEKYSSEVADLKEMLKQKFITPEVFNKGLEQAQKHFADATGAAKAYQDALRGIQGAAFGSAEAMSRMNAQNEMFKGLAPLPLNSIEYKFKNPDWMNKLPNFQPDAPKAMQQGMLQGDQDRDAIVKLLGRMATSLESIDKKPSVNLKPANLASGT